MKTSPASHHNLYALFQSCFPVSPDAVFLQSADGGQLLYRELDYQTGQLAALLKNCGIRKGDRVVVQVEKSAAAVVLYLACLRIGAIYIPLNTAYTAEEVGYFLEDARPLVFVCAKASESVMSNLAQANQIPHLFALDAQGHGSLTAASAALEPDTHIEPCAPEDIAAILYTSGTTGRSKGAMLSHANLASNARTLHRIWHWQPGDVLLHSLPIYHVHGLFVALHCALLNGSRVLFEPKFAVDRMLELLPQTSVMMGVPTFYTRLLAEPRFNADCCRSVRLFISGSAPLLATTFDEFYQRTVHKILERYGMTEAGMITSNPYDGERLAGTVGYPLPEVTVRVVDRQGIPVATDAVGMLEIKGPNVFQGYWQMPEKTREEFRDDGFFITGDLATMTGDGRVSIVGRAKDMIISGGLNVYPSEVETLLDTLPGVRESAVIGLPHPDLGEAVTAVIVPEPGGATGADMASLSEQQMLAALHGRLAGFKQPKRVLFVADLPRNTMGKVQKKQLRESYAGLYQ